MRGHRKRREEAAPVAEQAVILAGLLAGWAQAQPVAEVTIEGMRARWQVEGPNLVVQLEAETTGWLLIGFNDRDDIVGADLKFVRVVDGRAELHDHHVVAAGDHRDDRAHGGAVEGRILGYEQRDGHTRVRLQLPLSPTDPHDHVLHVDRPVWMILAWSVSSDLDHHSRVRRHRQITLQSGAEGAPPGLPTP